MKKYEAGELIKGQVTGIEKYGIFVNLGDYNGLIHISEISDGYVRNINDYVKIGQEITVKVIDENDKMHHVRLSIKNIEYKSKKNGVHKIVETKHGFGTLDIMLKKWIESKLKELNKNKTEKN